MCLHNRKLTWQLVTKITCFKINNKDMVKTIISNDKHMMLTWTRRGF